MRLPAVFVVRKCARLKCTLTTKQAGTCTSICNMYIPYATWEADLQALRPEDRRAWVFNTLKNKEHLHIFGRFFFPDIIKGSDEVPECHLELIRELSSPDDRGIIFPRGFAKTTWEKIDTLHDCVYGLEPTILYISDTLQAAQFHFESIKAQLEENELLHYVYGILVPSESRRGRKWTNKHFETTNGVNVVARGRMKGRGVNIKNKRPTKIIIDDVEDDELVQSARQREKLARWLNDVIFPSKAKGIGRIKMIGTVLHTAAEVLKFYKNHGGIFRRAIENGLSIWPNYITVADLYRIRDGYTKPNGEVVKGIGSRAFAQEYLNEPTNADLAHIKPAWIDDATYVALPASPFPMIKVITCDPQAGEKDTADEYAITCLGYYERQEHKYVLEQKAGRASQFEQARELCKMWLRHKSARVVAVEKVLNQTAVYQTMLQWKSNKINFNQPNTPANERIDETDRNIPIMAWSPDGKDKVSRLQVHEPAFERKEIHLRPEMRELREQLMYLGSNVIEHDDRADSLTMALDLSYKTSSLVGNSNSRDNDDKNKTIAGNLDKMKF